MKTIPIMKSTMNFSVEPDWYRGHKTRLTGDYFGSTSSIAPNETYVSQDLMHIVHRDGKEGKVSVSRNACAHAGALLLATPGVQDHTDFSCPVHKWKYLPSGECVAMPYFEMCEKVKLHSPSFGIWNGYVIGYEQSELNQALAHFGNSLGHPKNAFSADEFVFMGDEVEYELPYPCELMMINYNDGYHVPLCHQLTFDAVADSSTYRWELSPQSAKSPVWYSIQEVRARPGVKKRMQQLMRVHECEEEAVGWARLHTWIEEVFPSYGVEYPIDKEVFALWASIYGNGYLMPELYEGGLFLAVSYLASADPRNPETGNKNFVEYYIHKNVPANLRDKAYRLFRHAYEQSAREDDELCKRLWAAHRLGGMNYSRAFHETLEAGDDHWRTWFKEHFVAR
jgi:nitrite reductase/ring-hydroxylating ferredoxin subunit